MARQLGGVSRPKVEVLKTEKKIQSVKKIELQPPKEGQLKPSTLKKTSKEVKKEFKPVTLDIALFQKQASSIFSQPQQITTIKSTPFEMKFDILKPTMTVPAQTVSRQRGYKTVGEIRQIRLGRRVDPFGRLIGSAKL